MKRFLLTTLLILTLTINPVFANTDPHDIIPLKNVHLESDNYVLMDRESGLVLTSKNLNKQIHPASITKVLTTITALEMLEGTPLTTTYELPQSIFDGLDPIASVVDFKAGDIVTLSDILHGIILPSGADATRAISVYLTGTPEGLAINMNEKAKEIGMSQSTFMNTSGLDDSQHLSTVYDLALLVQYSLKNPQFKKLYSKVEYTTSPTPKYPDGIPLTNKSLKDAHERGFDAMYGAKSGYTELAQVSLSSVASTPTGDLIFISTSAQSHEKMQENPAVTDAIAMYERAFNDFKRTVIIPRGNIIGEIPIVHVENRYPVSYEKDIISYLPKGVERSDLQFKLTQAATEFRAPVEANSVLGTLKVVYNDTIIFQDDIINKEPIEASVEVIVLEFLQSMGGIIGISIVATGIVFYFVMKFQKMRRRNHPNKWREAQQQNESTDQDLDF